MYGASKTYNKNIKILCFGCKWFTRYSMWSSKDTFSTANKSLNTLALLTNRIIHPKNGHCLCCFFSLKKLWSDFITDSFALAHNTFDIGTNALAHYVYDFGIDLVHILSAFVFFLFFILQTNYGAFNRIIFLSLAQCARWFSKKSLKWK